ncbi:hypothetical protein NDU88_004706 [Pleurodeles waltl]|uniref:Uncharacterized protein n=1 Tax=Pleurodeles waltl TaxID=8319 RepID=A0AAV7UH72_PLEWA|nr:hypothetical protein NDU88_004706 [Pleurodeles waltl]
MAVAPARYSDDAHGGPVRNQTLGTEDILMELLAGFRSIAGRFDLLTSKLDSMDSRLGKQQTRLEGVEGRIFAIEYDTATLRKRLKKVEWRLKTV